MSHSKRLTNLEQRWPARCPKGCDQFFSEAEDLAQRFHIRFEEAAQRLAQGMTTEDLDHIIAEAQLRIENK